MHAGDQDADMADAGSSSGMEDGDLPLEPDRAWWEIRREWAGAVPEAGMAAPPPEVVERRLRTIQQTDGACLSKFY